jgi:hypothetical protein
VISGGEASNGDIAIEIGDVHHGIDQRRRQH